MDTFLSLLRFRVGILFWRTASRRSFVARTAWFVCTNTNKTNNRICRPSNRTLQSTRRRQLRKEAATVFRLGFRQLQRDKTMASNTVAQRSSLGRVLSLCVLVIASLAAPVFSWTLAPPNRGGVVTLRSTTTAATNSPLFGQQLLQSQQRLLPQHNRRRASSPLFSSDKDESEETEATSSSSSTEVANDSTSGDEEEEKFGVLRTILLAGPLFVKFTIVLL